MLETYFEAAHTLARLRSGPTGPFVDRFAASLRGSGYTRRTARDHLREAAHLGMWMEAERLDLGTLGEHVLAGFGTHLRTCTCLKINRGRYHHAVAGARNFLCHLREQGILPPQPFQDSLGVPTLVEQFEQWMRCHRGVTASTVGVYRPILIDLVENVGRPDRFSVTSLREFVSEKAAQHGRSRAKTVVQAVRMFLRYLASHGLCEARLVEAIPTIAHWRRSLLPDYLSAEDVERLLCSVDQTTATDRRDHAILLLLARLGLRSGDVADLRFGDIDWDTGSIVVTGKGRRAAKLPLPQDVGDAILAYLQDGRPNVNSAHVFLRSRAPHRPLCQQAVGKVVNRAAARADVRPPRGGAHVLRHSLATSLVRAGVPLTVVGMLLRHQSEESTVLYAKVDIASLRWIAQPWPLEVAPC